MCASCGATKVITSPWYRMAMRADQTARAARTASPHGSKTSSRMLFPIHCQPRGPQRARAPLAANVSGHVEGLAERARAADGRLRLRIAEGGLEYAQCKLGRPFCEPSPCWPNPAGGTERALGQGAKRVEDPGERGHLCLAHVPQCGRNSIRITPTVEHPRSTAGTATTATRTMTMIQVCRTR